MLIHRLIILLLIVGCDNSTESLPEDCAGVAGGSAVLSGCDNACNSTAVVDECSVCDNDSTNDCTQDCENVWGGTAKVDECGVCDNDSTNDCTQDCGGKWSGSLLDENNDGFCDAWVGLTVEKEGYEYQTVQIGQQLWMAENLRTTKFNTGVNTDLEDCRFSYDCWKESLWDGSPAYTIYNNDAALESDYGYLYSIRAVYDTRDICPLNWHVPNWYEWSKIDSISSSDDFGMLSGGLYEYDDYKFLNSHSGFWIKWEGLNDHPNGDVWKISRTPSGDGLNINAYWTNDFPTLIGNNKDGNYIRCIYNY